MNTKVILAIAAITYGIVSWMSRTDHEQLAVNAAEVIVQNAMLAPGTAEFADVKSFRGQRNSWCVTGAVTALIKGGELSQRRFVVLIEHEGHWKRIEYTLTFHDFESRSYFFEAP